MDYRIHLIIHKRSVVYDNLTLMSENGIKNVEEFCKKDEKLCDNSLNIFKDKNKVCPVRVNKKGINSYLVSAYVCNLRKSNLYRKSAMQSLILLVEDEIPSQNNMIILIKLRNPKKQFLDYAWNDRITQMVAERREIDHAMSWLSTLGGAFSALGDEMPHCAEIAGKISIKQFKLAYRLSDPLLVARCKLYAALSLIQRENLKQPKHMIRDIYRFAVKEKDIRLQNMCKGVWAKLKYYHDRRKQGLTSIKYSK